MSERAAQLVRETLEQEIISGAFKPGDRLDEVSLAKRFEVSRTPIREALLGLAGSQLIELRPRRGAFVRELGPTELFEMFETMAELEAGCARLAAQRLDPRTSAPLRAALQRCASSAASESNTDAYYYENEDFHATIYAAARNSFLESQTLALRNRLKPFRRLQLHVRGRITQSQQEHEAISHAIITGDSEAAEKLARNHVMVQGERFIVMLSMLEKEKPERV
ncbi:MAG: GntR family transcriptional regulator [Neomegalonema sp.]|nr:GntR family transcriptional regulator [Neomegalonema sp.]